MIDPGAVFGALADDTRRTVFVRVAASGQATASELARDLPVTRQAVAKHLSLLASAGLVESERVGRETRFHARGEPLQRRDRLDGERRRALGRAPRAAGRARRAG